MITDRDFDLAMKRLREEMAETYGGGVERAEAAAKAAYELADKAYGQLSEIEESAALHARNLAETVEKGLADLKVAARAGAGHNPGPEIARVEAALAKVHRELTDGISAARSSVHEHIDAELLKHREKTTTDIDMLRDEMHRAAGPA